MTDNKLKLKKIVDINVEFHFEETEGFDFNSFKVLKLESERVSYPYFKGHNIYMTASFKEFGTEIILETQAKISDVQMEEYSELTIPFKYKKLTIVKDVESLDGLTEEQKEFVRWYRNWQDKSDWLDYAEVNVRMIGMVE